MGNANVVNCWSAAPGLFALDRPETKAKITLGDYSEHTQRPLLLLAAKTCATIL